jgi:hypothetical protein
VFIPLAADAGQCVSEKVLPAAAAGFKPTLIGLPILLAAERLAA